MIYYDVIIVGGGAAGFFTAINAAEFNAKLTIAILERGKEGLQKVKISGGGRCNVTHGEFNPQDLVEHYPRGKKELLGPFHSFMTGDTIEWFQDRGIELKIEEDGRMFPVSDSSETIIDCFLKEASKNKIEILYGHSVKQFYKIDDLWTIETSNGPINCEKLVVATGSNNKIWHKLFRLGHKIVEPVPSLFTFNIKDKRIEDIAGVTIDNVEIQVIFNDKYANELRSNGPLLITHWGMSAPAILKLSAFGARQFAKYNYKFQVQINFINQNEDDCLDELKSIKLTKAKKQVLNNQQFNLPKRFWNKLVEASSIKPDTIWADLNRIQLVALTEQLTKAIFNVEGKSTFKEEFVTSGGVDLREIDFKRFESKLHKNLFFAGEVLNIDAVTGGFNFQNAWTGGYIVAKAVS